MNKLNKLWGLKIALTVILAEFGLLMLDSEMFIKNFIVNYVIILIAYGVALIYMIKVK